MRCAYAGMQTSTNPICRCPRTYTLYHASQGHGHDYHYYCIVYSDSCSYHVKLFVIEAARRTTRSTRLSSSAASDGFKRQGLRVDNCSDLLKAGDGSQYGYIVGASTEGTRPCKVSPPRVMLTRDRVVPVEPFPVSYTHLRAHETVLHLVCRLLLEKN